MPHPASSAARPEQVLLYDPVLSFGIAVVIAAGVVFALLFWLRKRAIRRQAIEALRERRRARDREWEEFQRRRGD